MADWLLEMDKHWRFGIGCQLSGDFFNQLIY
jgi:hypothetical protein